jgi:hypothetical protein
MRTVGWLFLISLLVATAAEASATTTIPAFARRYGVSCSVCHDPAPRLTPLGEQFAANGFQFSVGETIRDTLDTGDRLLTLLERIEFAFRLDAFVSLNEPAGSDESRFDFQTPYLVKILTGGPIAEKISYYLYFFFSERGEVAGLEDAYIQFTDIGGTGASVAAGQFQISDPMFKRELRLEHEDYQLYRVRVGDARADLTYDRGFMVTYEPGGGAGLTAMVTNGQGIGEAGADRLYDRDPFKNIAVHLSQDFGPVRLGGLVYWGREEADGIEDEITIFGPDATLSLAPKVELNAQYLRRNDSNPLMVSGGPSTQVNAAMGELVLGPFGEDGRWYGTALYNWIDADRPLVSLRLGEQAVGSGFIQRYQTLTGGVHYLLRRNIRLLAEAGWDFERESPRFAVGSSLAW